mgnify:FL=1
MKINRKKQLVIQNGKPPKVKSIAELFQDNVKLVLSSVTMLILLMQVPWILYVLEPLWVPQTAFDPLMTKRTGVLFQILGNFMPICVFFGSAATMIPVAVSQSCFFSALAKEREEIRSCWNECAICVPILRYWILYRQLAQSARWPALVMIGSSMMFWGLAVVVGPLSPWVLLSFTVSVSAWLVIAKRLANGVVKRSHRVWSIVLLSLFTVSLLAGYITFYWTEIEIKAEMLMLHSAGIPTNREELEQHFYQGRIPNVEFGKLVDRNSDYNIKKGSECLESASWYYKLPESKRRKIKTYLTGELCQEDFKNIDALIESGDSLKYKMCFPNDYLAGIRMPHLNYYRTVMRYFSSRIIVALEDKKPSEAMRLFRLADKFQENVLQSDFLIGAIAAFACEYIRSDTISAMLGSGLLSDDNLSEILDLNHNREKKIRSAIRYGLCTEAYLFIDTVILLNVPYLKIMSEIRYDGQWQYEEPLLRFLFRGNTTVFPTLPCLWTEAIQQRYLLYAMRHQRAAVRYFDAPTSQRKILRADLKRELATRELYIERMLLPDYSSVERRLQRTLTKCKMTNLGLQIEQFRRKHGHLPETLDELGIPLPVDVLSGEPIRFTHFDRLFGVDGNGHTVSRDLPGWQLSAPGGNHERAPEEREESRRDFFTVITEWPVPAPPEPPKNNEESFDFMGGAGVNEEAAP